MGGKDMGKQKNNYRKVDQLIWELECLSQNWGLRESLNQGKIIILWLGNLLKLSLEEVWIGHAGHVLFATQYFLFFHWKKYRVSSVSSYVLPGWFFSFWWSLASVGCMIHEFTKCKLSNYTVAYLDWWYYCLSLKYVELLPVGSAAF